MRGAIQLFGNCVHYNKFGACLDINAGSTFGFRLSEEFSYEAYYPLNYEVLYRREVREEINTLYSHCEPTWGRKSLPLKLPPEAEIKIGRGSILRSLSMALGKRTPSTDAMVRMPSVSTDQGHLTVHQDSTYVKRRKSGVIWNPDTRRMHRFYLNMDMTSHTQRAVWMDVLRHQLWLINHTQSAWCVRDPSNVPTHPNYVEAMSGMRIYDVEGSPPTESNTLYLSLTVDMMILDIECWGM